MSLDCNDLNPIRILRNPGASQSLLIKRVLSLSEKSYTDSDVFIQL